MTQRRIAALVLLVVGIVMIPLPGPGWPVVFAALAMGGWKIPGLARYRGWLPETLHAAFDRVTVAPVASAVPA
jgi:hypothetical protein